MARMSSPRLPPKLELHRDGAACAEDVDRRQVVDWPEEAGEGVGHGHVRGVGAGGALRVRHRQRRGVAPDRAEAWLVLGDVASTVPSLVKSQA